MNSLKHLLTGALLASLMLCRIGEAEENLIRLTPQQIENLGISLGKPEAAGQIPLFSAPATVTVPPDNDYVVSSTQAGLVEMMKAAVGDKVNKGELIAVVNSPDLLNLQSGYLKARSTLKVAAATYNRDKKLLKEGVVSGRDEQASAGAYKAAWVDANEARQLLSIAGMDVAELKKLDVKGELDSRIKIRAPVTGWVLERPVSSGTRVDNLTPLYRIADLDELWLEIKVPQEQIRHVAIGTPVQVENGAAEAVVKLMGESVNPETQTVLVRAIVKGKPLSIKAGQKVTVQVNQSGNASAYKLPEHAIAHNEGRSYVFIRHKDGFKVSEVTVLGKQADAYVVSASFSGLDEIALNNVVTLKASWLGLGSDE